uniref:Transposase n=1 Tax=Rhabditophanes sp. KR3021 TaxID=114890 RepID=A0AC35UA05_9BILA
MDHKIYNSMKIVIRAKKEQCKLFNIYVNLRDEEDERNGKVRRNLHFKESEDFFRILEKIKFSKLESKITVDFKEDSPVLFGLRNIFAKRGQLNEILFDYKGSPVSYGNLKIPI